MSTCLHIEPLAQIRPELAYFVGGAAFRLDLACGFAFD
jgi:hypothetical protein